MDLYASKGAINSRLEPLVSRLAAAGVSADSLTLAAVACAVLGAGALFASPSLPLALLAVPPLALLRLLFNLLDGQVARHTGLSHPRGELLNEVADRLADICFIAPVAVLPGAWPQTVWLGLIGALLASYIGVASRAAGGRRIYRGVLSKPGRMAVLALFAVAVFFVGSGAWWAFGPLLLIGTALTVLERLAIGLRELP